MESIARGSPTNQGDKEEIIFVTKQVKLSSELPRFDEKFYQWKRNYWKNAIKSIKNIVAPMVDQSELAFRMMLRQHSAHLCYTPMIHANLFVNDYTYRKTAFSTVPADRPLIVQFCANDPKILLDACRLVEGFCDGVDLNLGCPQLIAKKGRYGSYLQEFPELISSMIRQVYDHCRLPISAKIRIHENLDETIAYAKMIEKAGASMITIHGRMRDQRGVNTGLADWIQIRELKRILSIPVIANGNIQLFGDIEKCLIETGADAVMSAEGILNNPILFDGENLCAFDVACEYLKFAECYKANVSAIRAHIFRICHYSLLKHRDLREKNSCVFSISHFQNVIDELRKRCLKDDFGITEQFNLTNDSIEQHKRRKINLLTPSEEVQLKLRGPSDLMLLDTVNSVPYWLCKPYVRSLQPQSVGDSDQTSSKSSADVTVDNNYRAERKAEMARICEETGLSKRQIRKRERRRIEMQRKIIVKWDCPKCERCQQPAGQNCHNSSCKRCCKLKCVRLALDCKSHGFSHVKMHEKRVNYAKNIGITLEELLERETKETDRLKYLKNAKKPTPNFGTSTATSSESTEIL